MQVDSTNVMVNRIEDPLKDLGLAIVGNIVDYSSSSDEEKDEENEEKIVEKEVRTEKVSREADTLIDAWKRIVHESMLIPQLKKAEIVVDKVEFQPKPTKFYVVHII